jgi:beta-lactamase regulating signal transducer with metallopeptidase domain
MDFFLPIAAKSFLVAGTVLLLLKLAQNRSASDRSWIAHLGLVAVLLLPLAALTLPALEVAGPSFLAPPAKTAAPAESIAGPQVAVPALPPASTEAATDAARFPVEPAPAVAAASVDWAFWAYILPAALLLLLTVIALVRLFRLKGRASVMVEPHWLSALARAQRRMGFKHGTALLASDELPSPISWGLVRPVILLNSEAAESHSEAEAIIAHELAHVASLDWAKLLVSRATVAIFWFNPLVWVLAREAHQLREEAADDAVLGADIEDTEYARLLVGVARHQCRGLLLGAHGVAPARNSLARRVRRVLDGALERAPGGWRWSTAAAFFAAGMAVPVAALNFVPTTPVSAPAGEARPASAPGKAPVAPYYTGSAQVDPDLADTVGETVAASVAGALAAAGPDWSEEAEWAFEADVEKRVEKALAGKLHRKGESDHELAMRAVGATREYAAALAAAAPHLAKVDSNEFIALAAVGVSAAYIRELANAGYGKLDADELVEARALNLRGDYIRGLAAAGYRNLSIDQLGELRAMGVTGADIQRFRRAGHTGLTVDRLVELKATGAVHGEIGDSERDVVIDAADDDDADDGS